jgi:hypothetical protein
MDTSGESPRHQSAGGMMAMSLTSLFSVLGAILELHLGYTWSLSENPVLMLDERWWRSWRRTLLEGIVS